MTVKKKHFTSYRLPVTLTVVNKYFGGNVKNGS